jgi:hypothetical protein
MTSAQIKADIDLEITNVVTDSGVTNTNVGARLKDMVDYTDQEILETEGLITAVSDAVAINSADIITNRDAIAVNISDINTNKNSIISNDAEILSNTNDIAVCTKNADTDVSANDWVLDENDLGSNSSTKVPTQQSVKAYVDASGGGGSLPYKEVTFTLSISGLTPTPTYLVNDLSEETITMTIPSNGKLRIEATGGALVDNKVFTTTNMVSSGGVPYFLVPDAAILPIFYDINIIRYDNDQSSTPSLSDQLITIKIYD